MLEGRPLLVLFWPVRNPVVRFGVPPGFALYWDNVHSQGRIVNRR